MAKFKKGDKVRVLRGDHAWDVGVVEDPWFQIAANDWPWVILKMESGESLSVDEDHLELAEDPYEYGVLSTNPHWVRDNLVWDQWNDREGAESLLRKMTENYIGYTRYRIVKRLKAGKMEEL